MKFLGAVTALSLLAASVAAFPLDGPAPAVEGTDASPKLLNRRVADVLLPRGSSDGSSHSTIKAPGPSGGGATGAGAGTGKEPLPLEVPEDGKTHVWSRVSLKIPTQVQGADGRPAQGFAKRPGKAHEFGKLLRLMQGMGGAHADVVTSSSVGGDVHAIETGLGFPESADEFAHDNWDGVPTYIYSRQYERKENEKLRYEGWVKKVQGSYVASIGDELDEAHKSKYDIDNWNCKTAADQIIRRLAPKKG